MSGPPDASLPLGATACRAGPAEPCSNLAALGLRSRLARLFHPRSGNCLIVAMDHGVFMGPLPGIENLARTAALCAAAGADALQVGPRAAQWIANSLAARAGPSLVLRIDSTNAYRRAAKPARFGGTMIAAVADAAAAGADAVVVFLLDDPADPGVEQAMIERLAPVLRDARGLGMPVMIEPLVMGGAGETSTDAAAIDRIARIAYELGADLLKIDYPGEAAVAAICAHVAAPVLIRGGPRVDDANAFLRAVEQAMRDGARGVVFGRNLWQAADVAAATRELARAVHGC